MSKERYTAALLKSFLLVCISFSCQYTDEVAFPYHEVQYAKPQKFSVAPVIIPVVDSLLEVVHLKDRPIPTRQQLTPDDQLKRFEANANVKKLPDDLERIKIDIGSLTKVPFKNNGDVTRYVINVTNDTILTGQPIPSQGVKMDIARPQPVPALHPISKDNVIRDISYLDVEHGLPSAVVWTITEDHDRNLWFGGIIGLIRYDGTNFVHYSFNQGFYNITASMTDHLGNLWFGGFNNGFFKYDGHSFTYFDKEGSTDETLSLLEDRSGNIWFGTQLGAIKYDHESFVYYTENEGLINNVVNALLEDAEGNMWFGTNKGVSIFDGTHFMYLTENEGVIDDVIQSLYMDNNHNIWIGTESGISKYDGSFITNYGEVEGIAKGIFYTISEDSQGNIWVCASGYGCNQITASHISGYTDKEGLNDIDIYANYKDASGNLWVGDNGAGVHKIRPSSFHYFTRNQGLIENTVYSILEDKEGVLWFGTETKGITKYDGNFFYHLSEENGLNDNGIASLFEDSKGNLWIGSYEGGISKLDGREIVHYTEAQGLWDDKVNSIIEDVMGNIWIGFEENEVCMFDGESFTKFKVENGMVGDGPRGLLEDSKGNLWFGCGSGLSKYDGSKFENYIAKESVPIGSINVLMEDKSGRIWIGSAFGVWVFDGDFFYRYSENEGLSNNLVWSIAEDQNHNVWVATEAGLNQFVPFTTGQSRQKDDMLYKIITYDDKDGIQGLDFVDRSILIDKDERLWLGASRCLTMLDLKNHRISPDAPSIQMRQVDINGQFIDYATTFPKDSLAIEYDTITAFDNVPVNLKIPYDQNRLTFHYSAIDWDAPHQLEYSYVLEGFSESWSSLLPEIQADYRNIPEGEYTFRVRAIGKNKIWSEEAIFNFIVHPPWYRTWWAYTVYLIALFGLVFSYTDWRTRNLKHQKKTLEDTVSRRTADLKQSNQQLEEQKEEIKIQAFELEKLNELKSKFYSVVGHDLRSLLTELFSIVYKIKRAIGNKNSEMRTAFSEFDSLYRQFGDLLDNVLDWGLMDSKDKKITLRPELLNELVEHVVHLYHPFARDKKIDLHSSGEMEDESLVKIDKGSIEIVLRNLISNAIKFTKEGGSIEVKLFKREQVVGFRVIDTGVGIPVEKLQDIFEIKDKKGTLGTKGEKGSGLGLKLAHDFVKMNQGEINIQSEKGKGTTISVSFPTSE